MRFYLQNGVTGIVVKGEPIGNVQGQVVDRVFLDDKLIPGNEEIAVIEAGDWLAAREEVRRRFGL